MSRLAAGSLLSETACRCRVTRAARGSAVFEVVSERVYSGVVLERMHAKGTNVTSGLLQALDDDAIGRLTYGPKDLAVRAKIG